MRKQLLATLLCVCMVFGSAGAVMADEKAAADTAGEVIAVEEAAVEGAEEDISEEEIVPEEIVPETEAEPEAAAPEAAEPETAESEVIEPEAENTAGQDTLPLMEGDPFEGYEIFDIVPDEETTVTINPDEARPLYRFVPAETGDYRFESFTDDDTKAYLYDENMENLKSDDDGGSDYNFKLDYMLEAGNTYYYSPVFFGEEDSGCFDVKLTKYFENHFDISESDDSKIFLLEGDTKTVTVYPSGVDISNITYQWYMYDYVNDEYIPVEGANESSYVISGPGKYKCTAEDGYGGKLSRDFLIYYCNTENIVPDTDNAVTIDEPYRTTLYKFVPEKDGGFIFSGSAEGRDFELFLLDEKRGIYSSNSSYTEGSISDNLEAGKTYYYAVSMYDYTGEINVRLSSYTENSFWAGNNDYNDEMSPGTSQTLSVYAEANDESSISYAWYLDNEPLPGASDSEYTIDAILGTHTYKCRVEDGYGSFKVFVFEIHTDNDFYAYADNEDIVIAPGEVRTLEPIIEAIDTSRMTYTWDFNGEPIEGANESSYTAALNGTYKCHIDDGYGHSRDVWFWVYVESDFWLDYAGNTDRYMYAGYGDSVKLEVIAKGEDSKDVTYQWSRYDYENDKEGYVELDGGTSATILNTGPVTRRIEYRCRAENAYGSYIYSYITVEVENHFSIDYFNDDIYAAPGQSVELTVNARADDMSGMKYEWYFWDYEEDDYIRIGNADGPSYTIDSVTGWREYYCRVTDKYGARREAWFYVRIDDDPDGQQTPSDGQQTPSDGEKTPTPTPTPAPEPEKTDISSGAAVSVSAATYTGNALTPAVTVTLNNRTLKKDTDYTVKYENNVNAGKGRVVITGTGSYKGTKTQEFTIGKAASAISLKAKSVTYNGKNQNIGAAAVTGSKGAVTYTYYSDSACKKKVTAHKKAGTYYVKAAVAEDANYLGNTSSAVKLTIKKAKQPLTVKGRTPALKAKTVKKKAQTIKASKAYKFTKKAQGKITYKKTKGNKNITVNKKTGAITVKKGLKKGTYSIKVKLTAAGNANYKGGSKTVTVKIKIK